MKKMEKPTARGPSPDRKAQLALGETINRKSKPPPPLPEAPKEKRIQERGTRSQA